MKYTDVNDEQKLEDYFKAVRMRLETGASREEIVENTRFPSWRVLEFFMTRNRLTIPSDKAAFNKQVDINFFNSIDSLDKAYILGFIYTDGCIYDDGRMGFCITESDESVLHFIKEKMNSISNIRKIHNTKGAKNRQPQLLFRISSVKIVEALKKFGLQKNKTLNEGLIFPDFDEEYMSAFLRGISDGDGNIYFKPGKNETTECSVFRWTVCMTDKPFLIKLKDYFNNKGITISLYEKKGKTCRYYILSTGARDSAKLICDIIYRTEGFCLLRKKHKYLEYKRLLDNTVLNTEIKKSVSV